MVSPLAYCFPGGGIEAGESEAAALVREIQEELGVEVQPVQRLWESLTPWNVHLAWWRCLSPPAAAFTANPAEIESIHWHTPDEIRLLPGLLEQPGVPRPLRGRSLCWTRRLTNAGRRCEGHQ